jgi:hypothetical protein
MLQHGGHCCQHDMEMKDRGGAALTLTPVFSKGMGSKVMLVRQCSRESEPCRQVTHPGESAVTPV